MAAPNPAAPVLTQQQLRNYILRHYLRGESDQIPHPSLIPINAYNTDPVPYKPNPWPGLQPEDFLPQRRQSEWRHRRKAIGRRIRRTSDITNIDFRIAPQHSPERNAYDRVRAVLGPGTPWPSLRFVKILGWGGLGVVALVQYFDWQGVAGNHYVLKTVLDPNANLAIQNLSEEKRRMRVSLLLVGQDTGFFVLPGS